MAYDYPLLSIPEILDCFSESNINVTKEDLSCPDPRKWHEIYAKMFEMLAFRPIDQVIQSLFKLEKMQTEYPDLFDEGFAQMAFTICLQATLSRFGFPYFCIKDVIQPSPKRVYKITCIFFNALRHIQNRRYEVDKIIDKIQSLKSEFENVQSQNKKLKEYLASANNVRPQREAELQRLQAECDQEQHSCFELNKIHEEERRAIDELKLRSAEIDAEKENIKQQLLTVSHDVEKLSQKIVQSPQRFRKELEQLKKKVNESESDLAKKEQSLSENRLLLERTVNKLTTAGKAMKLAKEVSSDLDQKNAIMAEIQTLTETCQEQKELYNNYCMQQENIMEKLKVREEQQHKLASQRDVHELSLCQQMTDHRQHQDKMKETLKKLETEIPQLGASVATVSKEIAGLDKVLAEEKTQNQSEIADFIVEAQTLDEMVNETWKVVKAAWFQDEESH